MRIPGWAVGGKVGVRARCAGLKAEVSSETGIFLQDGAYVFWLGRRCACIRMRRACLCCIPGGQCP